MLQRAVLWSLPALLLLTPLTGCPGDDDDDATGDDDTADDDTGDDDTTGDDDDVTDDDDTGDDDTTTGVDVDGDGWPAGEDCDDTDAALNWDDADGDGASTCDEPADCDDADGTLNLNDNDADGATTCDGDCDDQDPALNLDDADGDGETSCGDGVTPGDCDDGDAALNHLDADGDGFDSCGDGVVPVDCDDTDGAVFPGADELCDGLDNDCDPATVEDADGDGDGAIYCMDCDDDDAGLNLDDADGDGYTTCDEDCDDTDPRVFPEAAATTGWQRACEPWLRADTSGAAVPFTHHRVEQAHWLYDGAMLAMYFRTGYQLDEMVFGAYYTGDFGQSWTLAGPVYESPGPPGVHWDGEGISNPSVVYDAADAAAPYKLYYSCLASQLDGQRHIGMATSADGLSFTHHAHATPPFDTVKLISPGAPGDFDEEIVGTPYVFHDGAGFVMLYHARNAAGSGICRADSADGYSWTKWDPAPGVGDDPQPLIERGAGGDWDADSIAYPVPVDAGGTRWLLHTGRDAGGVRATGAAHDPFAPQLTDGVTKLTDLGPVFERAWQPDRFDGEDVYVTDVLVDGGTLQLFYAGSYADPSFDGGQVTQIGRASNDLPSLTLTAPAADPHTMTAADPLTIAGTANDTGGPLDTLYVVIDSDADPAATLTALADAAGDWTVTAPAGTYPAGTQTVVVTVYDEGGGAASTSFTLDVQ